MSTVRKRVGKNGVSWQIDYFDPNGKRVRQSFKKKKDAVAELGKRVSLMAEKRYLDVKKDYTTTFGELLDKSISRRVGSVDTLVGKPDEDALRLAWYAVQSFDRSRKPSPAPCPLRRHLRSWYL